MLLEQAGFFDMFSIARGEMLLDFVYQHQSASEVTALHTSLEEKGMEKYNSTQDSG